MLVKIEARILIFPGTDFHFPSTPVPPGTFLGSALASYSSRDSARVYRHVKERTRTSSTNNARTVYAVMRRSSGFA